MILIRGMKNEAYARKIQRGIVDCRDILSALLKPPITGYAFSDYYEKNLVKALLQIFPVDDFHTPQVLYSILNDYFIPHIYLTYFHVLNENSLEWLNNFDDEYYFIALNVKIDKITQAAIGHEYFGTKMTYANSIRDIRQDGSNPFYAACMCSLEHLFSNQSDIIFPLNLYNTLAFPLLCRELDNRFTDIENEFRIIAYDCPRLTTTGVKQMPRIVTITGSSGNKYTGSLDPSCPNPIFRSDLCIARDPHKTLKEILSEEHGRITISSQFKSINIQDISDDYKYLGNKISCTNYIKQMIEYPPKDIYINRTVYRTYNLTNIPDARFFPGYQNINY